MKDLLKQLEEGAPTVRFNLRSTGRADWDRDILGNPDRFSVEVVTMPPSEFLERVRADRYLGDEGHVQEIAQALEHGGTIPTPTMLFSNGAPTTSEHSVTSFHDGSHRVKAMKALGVKKIKVLLIVDQLHYDSMGKPRYAPYGWPPRAYRNTPIL